MLEYWIASNTSGYNGSNTVIEGVLQNPGSTNLFVGYPRWLLNFAAGCCLLFMLVGIPGNLFTVIALFRTTKLRNATAIFIMNLSISDLMFCCFNLPLATSTFWYSSWRHGALLCRLFPFLRYGLLAVSLFTILAITINRYVMIGHPGLYSRLYKSRYLIPMILATWIIAFGLLIITWFERWGRFGLDPTIGSCSILPDVYGRSPKEFLFVLAFLTPCIAIVVCYARIFYIVRKTACRSQRKNKTINYNTIEVNYDQRSLTPRSQDEEELSVLSSKQLIVSRLNPENNSEIVSNSPIRGSSLVNPSLYEQDSMYERKENETEIVKQNRQEETTFGVTCTAHDSIPAPEIMKDSISTKTDFEIKINDIPFVDEYNDSDVSDYQVFLNFNQNRRREPKELEKVGKKLETMTSKATFIVESALWVQRVKTSEVNCPDRTERFVNSRSNSPQPPAKKRINISPRESNFRGVGKGRNLETPLRMSKKDKKLLQVILVIFSSFLVCYLPITITKIFKHSTDWKGLNIAGYILIYLTTCINPVIYVVMSSEYRMAYKNVLLCKSESTIINNNRKVIR